ncbi:MAG: OmpA family protein [Bdellovibrionota bacterium]
MGCLKNSIQLNFTLIALFFALISFCVGCANKAQHVDFPEGASPNVEMGRLEADIQQGELNQVDITSPNYFSVAKRKLAEARKLESEGKSEKKILQTVGEGRGNLNYALTQQQEARGEINDILDARQMALKAGALEQSPSEFQRIDEELKNAVKDYKPNKEYLSFSEHQAFKNKYYSLQSKAMAAQKNTDPTAAALAELNFDPTQAEVIRDGEKITIRLKGDNFAPGQAKISDNAIPALDKVKQVLSSLDQEQVTIEGFTDSTGSTKVNQKISEDRAAAVADYLLAPNVITQEQIEFQGLGSKKPVTSNLTKEGRAANRRVDIIIIPTKME